MSCTHTLSYWDALCASILLRVASLIFLFIFFLYFLMFFFFFQAEDGIRDLVRSRGLGDVYKRQLPVIFYSGQEFFTSAWKSLREGFLNIDAPIAFAIAITFIRSISVSYTHLTLPTSDLV